MAYNHYISQNTEYMMMRAIDSDNFYSEGNDRKLEGLQIAVKDNIDVRFHYTTAGHR